MLTLPELQWLIQTLNARPFPSNGEGQPLTGAQAKVEAQNQFAVEQKLGQLFEAEQQKAQMAAAAKATPVQEAKKPAPSKSAAKRVAAQKASAKAA